MAFSVAKDKTRILSSSSFALLSSNLTLSMVFAPELTALSTSCPIKSKFLTVILKVCVTV